MDWFYNKGGLVARIYHPSQEQEMVQPAAALDTVLNASLHAAFIVFECARHTTAFRVLPYSFVIHGLLLCFFHEDGFHARNLMVAAVVSRVVLATGAILTASREEIRGLNTGLLFTFNLRQSGVLLPQFSWSFSILDFTYGVGGCLGCITGLKDTLSASRSN